MKKRKLKDLSLEEQAQIMRKSTQEYEPHDQIAAEYRISASLVGRLAKKHVGDPTLLEVARNAEERKRVVTEAI